MPEYLGDALLRLGTDSKNYDQGIVKARRGAEGLEKNLHRTSKAASFLSGKLIAIGAGLAATFGAGKILSGIVKTSSSFEQMAKQLDIIGTKGKGQETLEKLNKWALEMPVNTEQAVQAFIRMKAFGLEPTLETMETLTDVSVIFGEDALRAVSLAMGQISSLGRVSAQDLNQLANVGINARQIIKETFGVSVEELQKSNIEHQKVIDALWKGMRDKFGGAAKAGMTSWQGLTAVFKSYVTELQRQIGNAGVFDMLKKRLESINKRLGDFIANNGELIKLRTEQIVKGMEAAFDLLGKAVKKINADIGETIRLYKILRGQISRNPTVPGAESFAGAGTGAGGSILGDNIDEIFNVRIPKGSKKSTDSLVDLDKEIKSNSTDIRDFGDEGETAFEALNNAVTGWGSHFSRTMTDALFEGKHMMSGLLESFARMLTEMMIQIKVVNPILRAFLGENGYDPFAATQRSRMPGGIGPTQGGSAGIFAGLRGILGFAKGGVVPGPVGAPVPAIVHGGEMITPVGGGGGAQVSVYVYAPEGTKGRAEESDDGNGGRRIDIILDEKVAENIRPGTRTFAAITKTFNGMSPQLVGR